MKRLLLAASLGLALAACNDQHASNGRSQVPIPPQTVALMSTKGMSKADPILVRIYKKESELEVWKRTVQGEYAHLKTYPICRWSGQLGPKRREGDRQAPEGFYTVTPGHMNPNSSFHLSFDTGFPNAYDRAHGGTGSHLMVHGSCSSRGCYAMTDEGISEVYALARESFAAGQKGFQLQAYPFRMTAQNLAKFRNDPHMPFWKNLKEGSDVFEITKREAKVAVCNGRYAFNTVDGECAPDPTLSVAVREKDQEDRREVAELVAKGTPAMRVVYADGGQHESFRSTALASMSSESAFPILDARPSRLGEVSRPEALAQGPQEIPVGGPATPGRATLLASAAATRKVAGAASVPGRSEPRQAPIILAKAEPAAVPAEAAPDARPLYQRVLGNVFGSGEAAKSAAPAPVAAEAAAAAPASPVPPRRTSATVTSPKSPAAAPAAAPLPPRPQAATPRPQKHVDAGSAIFGSQPVGPLSGGFARN